MDIGAKEVFTVLGSITICIISFVLGKFSDQSKQKKLLYSKFCQLHIQYEYLFRNLYFKMYWENGARKVKHKFREAGYEIDDKDEDVLIDGTEEKYSLELVKIAAEMFGTLSLTKFYFEDTYWEIDPLIRKLSDTIQSMKDDLRNNREEKPLKGKIREVINKAEAESIVSEIMGKERELIEDKFRPKMEEINKCLYKISLVLEKSI